MSALLSIGEFSRMTHVSIKALRHYDGVGLLQPADVDAATGYRRYVLGQVPVAQAIRRFRDLGLPLDSIRHILTAEGAGVREGVLRDHLGTLEEALDRTQEAIAALHALLHGAPIGGPIEHRFIGPTPALAIRGDVSWDDAEAWLDAAFHELHGVVDAAALERAGPDGALYPSPFFEAHRGEVTAFVPVRRPRRSALVEAVELSAAHVAVLVHEGSFATLDATYGALGSHVTERGIGADGPIREHYLPTEDGVSRTEVCWPIRPPAPA